MEYDVEQTDGYQVEKSESIWKIDGPIGRLDFFWAFAGSIFFALPVILLKLIGLATVLFPICIILLLIAIWLYYAGLAKRFYDITGALKWGIIIAIVIFITTKFYFVSIGALFVGLFVPGKLLK